MSDTSVGGDGRQWNNGTRAVPEPKWVWRRTAVFLGLVASTILTSAIAFWLAKAGANAALLTIAMGQQLLQAVIYLVYLLAPSAEYVRSLGAAIKDARAD